MLKKDLRLANCELKFASGGSTEPTRFSGYASVFGGVDDYRDSIAPGAYARALKERGGSIPMLFAHDMRRLPPGKWVALQEDDKGLRVDGELTPGNTESANIAASLRHGSVTGLSIGFYVFPNGEEIDERSGIRTLKEIDLREISIVPMPADDSARVDVASVKAAIEAVSSISDAEEFLRDAANLSRSAAKTLLSRLKSVVQREAGEAVSGGDVEKLLRARIARLEADYLLRGYKLPT